MVREFERHSVPLFALIIGIDNYANCGKLRAAVTDANAIKQYLEEDLRVPQDHIITLFDEQATRDGIITAFKALRNDARISKGNPIVIYYSGHGTELPAPPAWGVESEIQCLLPQDYKDAGTEPIRDHEPIPDRTIGALIEDIVLEKGDNITVILDCCHSASGTRGLEDLDEGYVEEYVPRTVSLDINIPETLDDHIWRSRNASIANGFAYHGLQSHVLLAACGEKEFAYERKGSGLFTTALLKALRSCAVEELTYVGLLKQVQLKPQHPQCEGVNRHRVLFNASVSASQQVFHAAHARGTNYVISVGLAHGVSRGVELTLYNDRKIALGAVLVDEAAWIDDFETTITISKPLGNVSFAKLTRVGKIPVYVDSGGHLSSTLKNLLRADENGADSQTFRLVEAGEAKLEVAMENDGAVVLKVLDDRVKRFGFAEPPYKVTPDSVAHVLGSAAHYYWFLDLAKERDRTSTKHELAVDFYRLKIDYDDGDSILSPLEPGLCCKDPNSGIKDVIDFVVDPGAYYGIKITNNTQQNLYLNAFMFNNSSLGIIPYYTQSSAGKPEVPLKRGGTFTIGYGNGTPPLSFSLESSQDIDVSFLKIFFAIRPIDLSDVAQHSPFEGVTARGGNGVFETVNALMAWNKWSSLIRKTDTWFTLEIPVVQRRNAWV